MSAGAERILSDAEWLAHRYDPRADAFQFRHVPRARHAEVPFLTDDCLGADERIRALARERAGRTAPAGRLHFVFHSAFCASTMLVRALDVQGIAMGLSEPVVLNDLVGWRRRGAEPRELERALRAALTLLARPFGDGEAVVVKPSNILNPLAPALLALRPEARAILLYAPLPVFLASVARKGLWCRLWVRELLEGLLQDGVVDLGFEPRDYFRQSDLQVAAVGWLAQQTLFARLIERLGPGRIASLDSSRLTATPVETVSAVARHLGLVATDGAIAVTAALSRDSKTGAAFATGQREREQEAARAAHGDELEKVEIWARAVADNAGVAVELPCPLQLG